MKQNTTYKQTELGLIPEDWEVNRFTDIAELIHGFQFREEHFAENGRFGVIKIGNLTYQGNISLDNLSKSDCEGINNYERLFLRRGDILMALTGGTLGKMSIFNLEENRYLQNYRVGKFEPNEKSIKNYIYYLLSSTYVQKRIEDNVNEAAQPNFGKQDFDKIKIPLPPLPEQKKIADCLSTWDVAIEKQNALINALTDRKKALMQQLLTGKKRLPGFSGEWKEVSLIELADFRRGSFPQPYGLPEWYDNENGEPFIQVYDVGDNFNLKPTTKSKISELAQVQSVFIKKGTLIVTLQGSIGKVAITNYDAYIDRTLLLFSSFKMKVDIYFIMYQIHNLFNIEKEKAPGGIIKTITKEVLSNFKIKLPSFEEQTAIAEILATADRELQLQKDKLAQLQQQKKGLMQVLLTGKKRLIN